MTTECVRQGKWIGGCKWEPRYHVEEPTATLSAILAKQWSTTQADRDMLVRRVTYLGEVCTRCGCANWLDHTTEGNEQ